MSLQLNVVRVQVYVTSTLYCTSFLCSLLHMYIRYMYHHQPFSNCDDIWVHKSHPRICCFSIIVPQKCLVQRIYSVTRYGNTTVLLRRNFTCECERLASLAISHTSIICARAQVHVSGALPTRELKLASVLKANLTRVLASTRKRTREYSQMHSRVLANELASTSKR